MKKERAMELLNNVIDRISVAEKTSTTIEECLRIGFTKKELVKNFGFSKEDVKEVAKELKKWED